MNVRRTVEELEAAGAAGLTIEDTLLPQAFGKAKTQLISLEEGVGKVKAALDARRDPALVIMGRTGAAGVTDIQDAIVRAKAFEATGVDALFFTGIKTRADLAAVAAATSLPIVLGGPTDEMTDWDFLSGQRVKIAIQGHDGDGFGVGHRGVGNQPFHSLGVRGRKRRQIEAVAAINHWLTITWCAGNTAVSAYCESASRWQPSIKSASISCFSCCPKFWDFSHCRPISLRWFA